MSTTEIANRILEAYKSGIPIAPVRTEVSGVTAAYAVQRATCDAWIRAGRKPAGSKIGLTSKAVQEQLGVHEPDYGALFSDMILKSGAHIEPHKVLQPRVEPEVAFVLKTDLIGEKLTAEQVIGATDYVVPAVEVCGSRIKGWDIRLEDTVADNASSGLVVLGAQRSKPVLKELADLAVQVRINGSVNAEGRGLSGKSRQCRSLARRRLDPTRQSPPRGRCCYERGLGQDVARRSRKQFRRGLRRVRIGIGSLRSASGQHWSSATLGSLSAAREQNR
jgi:2-keto-4-pentenoate hydratase